MTRLLLSAGLLTLALWGGQAVEMRGEFARLNFPSEGTIRG